jgi:hypothetical protein
LRNVTTYEPEPPPVLSFTAEESVPPNYQRRLWLDSLDSTLQSELPIDDIFHWLVKNNPDRNTESILAGFTSLIFDAGFVSRFTDHPSREYLTVDGIIEGQPVQLEGA